MLVIIKDVLLINNIFLVNFQAKTINTLNYLPNRLSTKCFRYTLIPEKIQTRNKQNIQYLQIFNCKVSIFIPSKKYTKFDIYKIERKIFISYIDISKYV